MPTDASTPVAECEPEVQLTEHEITLNLHYRQIYRSFWLLVAWFIGFVVSVMVGFIVNAMGLLHSGNFFIWIVGASATLAFPVTLFVMGKHFLRLLSLTWKVLKLTIEGEPDVSSGEEEDADGEDDFEDAVAEAGSEIGEDPDDD